MYILVYTKYRIYSYLFERVCGRATNVILAPSAGWKGLPIPPLRHFRRRNSRKLAQSGANYPNSRIKDYHHMLCRNFMCWPHKSGLLIGIFWAPRTEKGPYRYERFGAFLAPGMWFTDSNYCVSVILGGKHRPQFRQSLGR